ncbi:SHOCT domain-containing protein [Natronosalvus halobius]|uniref:SHOCT domain-containing protein n=1 Tax=Natronosalvus halobius TaxID=2953746 RepID=UPI0020A16A00|nr:SHOCT domain-containing protein [Natronosalvus halobius]USZ71820.1 SHOCT domain-containing protein [Natronosalvus halobius]
MDEDLWGRFRANATGIASTLVTGLWLGLLVGDIGGDLWLAVLIVGYVGIVPAVSMLFDDDGGEADGLDEVDEAVEADDAGWPNVPGETDETGTTGTSGTSGTSGTTATHEPNQRLPGSRAPSSEDRANALAMLRTRYAAGELTDAQFEHKLERLLEVETLEDAEVWGRERDESTEEGSEPGERERSLERE